MRQKKIKLYKNKEDALELWDDAVMEDSRHAAWLEATKYKKAAARRLA